MPRDPKAYLWDIQQGCANVQAFLTGISIDEYLQNLLVRSAVERLPPLLAVVETLFAELSAQDPT